jgi:DNA-3-methyladenine glycosylase II
LSIKAKRHIQEQYPELSALLDKVKRIPKLKRRDIPLPEAVVRVVTGQMLSSQAASTIYGRIKEKATEQRLAGSWLLDHESLRGCGLSNSKARTIVAVSSLIGTNVAALDHWYSLPPDELIQEIKAFKGMGDWTASILALFYVGHEDIFPAGDGSLKKAITLIQGVTSRGKAKPFIPDRAAPYRSYLALYRNHHGCRNKNSTKLHVMTP